MTATPTTTATQFDRFTAYARAALAYAHAEATRLNHTRIGTAHLLLGLVREAEGAAGRTLRGLGVTLPTVRASVEAIAPPTGLGTMTLPARTLAADTKEALRRAVEEAERDGGDFVGTAHLLRSLLHAPDGGGTLALRRLDVNADAVIAALALAGREPTIAPTTRTPAEATGDDTNGDTARLVLSLPAADLARLLAVARERDVTVGDLMREAVAKVWLTPIGE